MSLTKTATLQPIPYLGFDGNCAEAMRYYEQVFGGKIKVMMSGAQALEKDAMTEAFGDKIINAQLELPGGGLLYAGDAPPHVPYEGMKGFTLALNFETVEEAEDMFNKFADGGQVYVPFGPTFWAERFGMVTDKFGVTWAINGALVSM